MTEDRDPLLQQLFAEVQNDLDGEVFIGQVMTQTRRHSYRVIAAGVCATLILAACAWALAIPQEFALLVAQGLSTTLVDLGDSWLAWIFSPVNNIASLLVLSLKGLRMGRKKYVSASYAN